MNSERIDAIEKTVNDCDIIHALQPERRPKWPPVAADLRALIGAVRARDGVIEAAVETSTALAIRLRMTEDDVARLTEAHDILLTALNESGAARTALEQENEMLKEALDQAACAVGSAGFRV